MSLVYTTLLSLVPLLAVSFSVLKGFGVHNQLEPLLAQFLAPLGEQGTEITTNVIGISFSAPPPTPAWLRPSANVDEVAAATIPRGAIQARNPRSPS